MIIVPTTAPPYERIDLRTSPEIKQLIVRASATAGQSVSAFLIAAAQDRARQVLAESEIVSLSAQDWEAFVQALDATDKPRPKLEAAMARYLDGRESQDGE